MIRPWKSVTMEVAIAGTILAVLVGWSRGYFSSRPPYPMIHADGYDMDFGRVKPSENLHASFAIENRGGVDLRIGEPAATCGCSKPKLGKRLLGPGEKTELTVEQDAGEQSGPFHHSLILTSNDPKAPIVQISLRGTVSRGVVIRPEPLVFDALRPGQSQTRFLEIASDSGKPITIRHHTASGPFNTAATINTPGLRHRVEVKFTAGASYGLAEGKILLNLGVAGEPPLMIPVRGLVEGGIRPSPSLLSLGNVVGYTEVMRRVVLRSSVGPFRLGAIEMVAPGWRLNHTTSTQGDRGDTIVLEVFIRVPDTPGVVKNEMSIKAITNDGKTESLGIPLYAVVYGRSKEPVAPSE